MENELLIPLFWTFVFISLIIFGLRRFLKKTPTEKKWVRPDPISKKEPSSNDSQK